MKKILFGFVLLSMWTGCKKDETQNTENLTEETISTEEENPENKFRQEAYNQTLKTIEGTIITFEEALEQYKGKPVLIDVWASWCPDCIKGMPKVHKLQEEYQLIYMFLSYDRTEQDWKAGIEKYKTIGENFLIQSDWKTGEFRKAIDLNWIPRYILVDQNGEIAHYNAIEADDTELVNAIKELTK